MPGPVRRAAWRGIKYAARLPRAEEENARKEWVTRLRLLLVAMLGFGMAAADVSCRTPPPATAQPLASQDSDQPLLFSSVARSIIDSADSIEALLLGSPARVLKVDPRPLRTAAVGTAQTSEHALIMAARPSLDTLSTETMRARIASLAGLHIQQGDVTSLYPCPGSLSTEEQVKHCPPNPTVIAVFGVTRQDSTDAEVQELVLAAAPTKMALIGKAHMSRRGGGWYLAHHEGWVIVE